MTSKPCAEHHLSGWVYGCLNCNPDPRLPPARKFPGIEQIGGQLFFQLPNGSTISCHCIGEPYSYYIAGVFAGCAGLNPAAYWQVVKALKSLIEWHNGLPVRIELLEILRQAKHALTAAREPL